MVKPTDLGFLLLVADCTLAGLLVELKLILQLSHTQVRASGHINSLNPTSFSAKEATFLPKLVNVSTRYNNVY